MNNFDKIKGYGKLTATDMLLAGIGKNLSDQLTFKQKYKLIFLNFCFCN